MAWLCRILQAAGAFVGHVASFYLTSLFEETLKHSGPVPSSRVKLTRRLTFDLTLG